ncbi:MAG: GAF domain-containing protein, partial [bacterium]
MFGMLPELLLPVVVALIIIFLSLRLQLFVEKDMPGRFAFISGGIIIFAAISWQVVEKTEAYQNWFIEEAYGYIDFAQFVVLLIGLIISVIGLAFYADYWQIRKDEIDTREHKLSILDNLQRDAKGSYQLMELLNISINEITSHIPESSGAVFLLNRARRQFVLTSSVGLTKEENALLEYYPLERNIISQSIDLGEPLISGQFTFLDRNKKQQSSRFGSCLVLPMVSGRDKIGGILLLAEESQCFNRQEIRYLQPIAEWLGEKIKATRLERELSTSINNIEEIESNHTALISRVMTATDSFMVHNVIESFCLSLVGMVSSKSAHLMGLSNGSLQYYGSSESLFDLSESYKTALVDAIDRRKPLIINQEGKTEDGRTFITLSTLVYPLPGKNSTDAIVLRRESKPFSINDNDLKIVDLFAHLAQAVLQKDNYQKLDLTRRRGFDTILSLLRFDSNEKADANPETFLEQLVPALPKDAQGVLFTKEPNGSFKAAFTHKVDEEILQDFVIYPGEGIVGMSVNNDRTSFVYGRNAIGKTLDAMDPPTREKFYQIFGEKGLPSFWAVCPINKVDKPLGVVVLFFDITESEKGEWERVLTLAA